MLDADDLLLDPPALAPAASEDPPALPAPARNLRETGLDQQLLVELVTKTLAVTGKAQLPVLATRLRLALGVVREVLDLLLAEQSAELSWRGDTDLDVQYQLTAAGRERAAACLDRSRYVGPAPVSLASYEEVLRRQSARHPRALRLSAGELAAALADEVLDPAVRDRVGAALYAGRSLLLYGPSGAGKTTLARKLGRLQQGAIAVPYALAVEGRIIQLHDPALHLPAAPQLARVHPGRPVDARWALCQRPLVVAGAELAPDALELRYDAAAGVYHAPPQLAANGGMLLLDDLGRQRAPIQGVLNRVTMALESGCDRLQLEGHHQITVPIDALVVLATSAVPHTVLDAAQLRRLGYKLRLGALSEANYRLLFRQQCRAAGVVFDEAPLAHLIGKLHADARRPLLACYPAELLARLVEIAGYHGQPARLTIGALEQAWAGMFASDAAE